MPNTDKDFVTEVSKIKPIRNYFDVLQGLKSNNSRQYGRRAVGTLHNGHMGQFWMPHNSSIENCISQRHSCFATVNTFKRGGSLMKSKRTGHNYLWYHHSDNLVTGLCGLFADLDAKLAGMKWGSQLKPLYQHLLDMADLPKPSFVVNSGHGLHILWLFNREVVIHSPNILPMWQKVEDTFVTKLSRASVELLGHNIVDKKVHDPARYLRIPTSYNCKHGQHIHVNTLEDNYISYSLTGYYSGLYYDYVGQYNQKWVNYQLINRKRARSKYGANLNKSKRLNERALAKHSKNIELAQHNKRLGKLAYLLIDRLADYKELIYLRNREGMTTGYRNELLFEYAKDRIQLNSQNSLLDDTKAINSTFIKPLGLGEVKEILRLNGNHNKTSLDKYKFTNGRIIDRLGITNKEQRHMNVLTGNAEKIRRKHIQNQKSSERCHKWRLKNGLIGKMTKAKWARLKNIIRARKLVVNHTKKYVAKKLNVSYPTIKRWLNINGSFYETPLYR